jgi:hypothetical protein
LPQKEQYSVFLASPSALAFVFISIPADPVAAIRAANRLLSLDI